MIIPETGCKIEGCKGKPKKDTRSGKRYYILGYCGKHYNRLQLGLNPAEPLKGDYRPAIVENDVAKLPLGVRAKDGYAIVDKVNCGLDQYNWCLASNGYVVARIGNKVVYLHRYICGEIELGKDVDHINRIKTDNRRCNLRFATRNENTRNRPAKKLSTTTYKGVCAIRQNGVVSYRAQIGHKSKNIQLGNFKTAKAAALAYDRAAKEYHKEYAYLNFPHV